MERRLDYKRTRKPFGWWHLFVRKGTLLHEVGQFIGDIARFIRCDFMPLKYLYIALLALLIIIGQTCFNIYDIIIINIIIPNILAS